MAQNAVTEIKNNLQYLDMVKNNLNQIKPYAKIGTPQINLLISGLKTLRSESMSAYNLLKSDLQTYYNETLTPLINTVSKISGLPAANFDTIKTGIDIIIKTIKGEDLDLETEVPLIAKAIKALKQMRQLIPLIPQTIKGTTALALIINDKLGVVSNAQAGFNMLPSSVKNALSQVRGYSAQLDDAYKMVSDKIQSMLNSAQSM
jgi:hypothetical protein